MAPFARSTFPLALFALAACSVFEPPIEQSGQDANVDAMTSDDGGMDAMTPMDSGTDAEVLPIPPRPALAACSFGSPMTLGAVQSATLDEVSGIAASRANARVVWMVEDSGSAAVVHAVNDLGATVATYMIGGAAIDNEDMAIGPGPMAGDYLYVADIGNNGGSRPTRTVYRAREPAVTWNQALVTGSLTGVEPLPFTFPPGMEDNAEAIFVDPTNQDLYVITKNGFTRPNVIFRLAAPHTPAVPRQLAFVGTIYAGIGIDIAVTAADISADGSYIAIRALNVANVWMRSPGVSIADTILLGTPCSGAVGTGETKGESISFGANGYFTFSEGVAQPLSFIPFAPD